MQLGLISDIHGNKVALEAVLEDMPDVDKLVCAGDIVGYNPWPAECVEIVREHCDVFVQGNHDRNVETPSKYRSNEMAHAGLKIALDRLDDEQLAWLADLPPRTTIDDSRILLAHSHPDPKKLGTYVRPRDFARMRPVLRKQYDDDPDGVVIGHTHIQHEARIDGKLVLNPGSVGQPRDGNPDAAYAVVDTDTLETTMERVEYDIGAVQREIEAVGLPDRTGARLAKGE